MSPRKKNLRPVRARRAGRAKRFGLSGNGPLLAGFALFLTLISPALRAPTSAIVTGAGQPGSEVRPFSLLALGAERFLSPGSPPAAWPGYPHATDAPADTPGPIASLIAAPAIALGEPVLAWNMAVVLVPWLTFIAMFLLCRSCTGNPIAAGVAGLGYALPPAVLLEPSSTFLLLSPLIPAAVLGTGGVIASRSRQAFALLAGIAMALALAPLPVAFATVIASGFVVVHQRPRDRPTIGRLLVCLALFLFLKALLNPSLLLPVGPRSGALATEDLIVFLPGGMAGPGLLIASLAAVALIDRCRGARTGLAGDPRALLTVVLALLPFLLANQVSVGENFQQTLPGAWLGDRYPIADSLRWSLRLVLPLGWCLLAAFGGLAILERVPSLIARRILGAVFLTGLILGNLFYPVDPISRAPAQIRRSSFLSPPIEEARLLRQAQSGALLDLPTGLPDLAAHRLLAAAWHRHATTSGSTDGRDAAKPLAPFAAAFAQPDGAEALATLGFGNILIHKHDLSPEAYAGFLRRLARGGGAAGRLTTRFESPGHLLLGLQGAFPISEKYDVLESNQPSPKTLTLSGPEDLLVFELQVRGDFNFRHPAPESGTPLRVEFFDFRSRLVSEHLATGLLPIAISREGTGHIALRLPLPGAPGRYTARLALQSDPALTLAIQSVEIRPAKSSSR
jgi:hypothetical protein